jgi:SSS family solute:Na+ symporter
MASELQFKGTVYPVHFGGVTVPGYAALWALVVNFAVAGVVSAAVKAAGVAEGEDRTEEGDYGEV